MGRSVQALRWRRWRYALSARRHRALTFSGPIIELPRDWRLERQEYWFWRVRLTLWAVFAAAGWLALSWPRIAPGVAAGILVELAVSYRLRRGFEMEPEAEPDLGSSAGMREPRTPRPTGDTGAAQLPADPDPPATG
jgi:hypothetical protein